MTTMKLSGKRALALGIVAVVAADWATKAWVQERLPVDGHHPVVEGWLSLLHKRNTGVAFSLLAEQPAAWRLPLLVLLSLLGIALCAHLMLGLKNGLARTAAGLVVAGAVGNLGDRVLNGAVTDFILVHFFPFVFNVADIAITVGAALLVLFFLFVPEAQGGGGGAAEEQAA